MGVYSTVPLKPSGFYELLDRKGYKAVRVGVVYKFAWSAIHFSHS